MSAEVEVADVEVIEHSQQLVPRPPSLTVTPQVQASDLKERLDVIRQAMEQAMQADVDYGRIPGTDKPALLKPGAEKLSVMFQLDVQLNNEKTWGPDDHLTVCSHATVYHAPTGARLGYGEGICTTREKKYAYRNAERACPNCGKANIRKSKQGDGFYCWVKTDGCGATFGGTDERITGQQIGQVDNPDLPDLWNTVVKMAEKRARVDAVLAVTGASALFTQDIEEDQQQEPGTPLPAAQASPEKPSASQLALLKRLINQHKPKEPMLRAMLDGLGRADLAVEAGWTDKLGRRECSALIDTFKNGVLPDTDRPSDIPADVPEADLVSADAGDVPWGE